MKKLEVKQMETLVGGGFWCALLGTAFGVPCDTQPGIGGNPSTFSMWWLDSTFQGSGS